LGSLLEVRVRRMKAEERKGMEWNGMEKNGGRERRGCRDGSLWICGRLDLVINTRG
jgi:hypothetical protein